MDPIVRLVIGILIFLDRRGSQKTRGLNSATFTFPFLLWPTVLNSNTITGLGFVKNYIREYAGYKVMVLFFKQYAM